MSKDFYEALQPLLNGFLTEYAGRAGAALGRGEPMPDLFPDFASFSAESDEAATIALSGLPSHIRQAVRGLQLEGARAHAACGKRVAGVVGIELRLGDRAGLRKARRHEKACAKWERRLIRLLSEHCQRTGRELPADFYIDADA